MAEHPERQVAVVLTARDGQPLLTAAGLWDEWKDRETGERLKSCTMIIDEPKRLRSGNPRPHAGVSGARAIRVLADRRSRSRASETSAERPTATLAGSEAGQ